MGRCEAGFNFQHHAIGAVGMVQQQGFGRAQFEHTRTGFHRHGAHAQHIAGAGQRAVVDRADAAEAATVQAANRRAAKGAGHTAQLPALRLRCAINVDQAHAGLGACGAVFNPKHLVVGRQIEQYATAKRHALAVIAGAATAHRERHTGACAGRDHGANLVFRLGACHRVGHLAIEQGFQHRAEPIKILAQALDAAIGDPLNATGALDQRGSGSAHGGAIKQFSHGSESGIEETGLRKQKSGHLIQETRFRKPDLGN